MKEEKSSQTGFQPVYLLSIINHNQAKLKQQYDLRKNFLTIWDPLLNIETIPKLAITLCRDVPQTTFHIQYIFQTQIWNGEIP